MGNDSQIKYRISEMSKGARLIFEENPYCILGLPCYASREEALERRDKLVRLGRIGASDSFVSEFDLSGVERPKRDHGSVQVAVSHLDQVDHVWLWFATGIYVKAWQLERRSTGKYDVSKSYDGFLAAYLFALINDPTFLNTDLWKLVFERLSTYLHMTDEELFNSIASRLNKEFKDAYRANAIIKSFRQTIIKPLLLNIGDLDGQSIQRIYSDRKTFSFLLDVYSEVFNERVLSWVSEKLVPIIDSSEKYNSKGDHKTSKEEVDESYRALYVFTEVYFPICIELEKSLDSITSDMMMSKVKDAVYFGVNPLLTGGKPAEAGKFDSLIFKYCNAFEKKEIKRCCPLEYLEIPDTEFTADECRTIATKYKYEGEGAQPDKYFLWNMRAAEKGNAEAQTSIGFCFARGFGCTINLLTATKWYRRAAQNGEPYAWSNLAYYYRYGRGGCTQDREEDFNCLIIAILLDPFGPHKKTMEDNHPNWKEKFKNKYGFSPDASMVILSSQANRGNTFAKCFWGSALFKGTGGVIVDKEKARRLLLSSSLGNCDWASILLKAFYGLNDKEATNGKDMYDLAYRYSTQNDPVSNDLRFYWYSKAVANNYTYAYNNLGNCYHDGIGTEKDLAQAAECYRKAVEKHPDNEVALFNYGKALFNGEGVARDPGLAKKMLLRSAAADYTMATQFLKENFSSEPEHEVIYENLSITVYCDERTNNGVKLKFAVENHDNRTYELWATDIWSEGRRANQQSRKILGLSGEIEAQVNIPLIIPNCGKSVDFVIQINDDQGNKLHTTSLVSLSVDNEEDGLQISSLEPFITDDEGDDLLITSLEPFIPDDLVDDDFTYNHYEGVRIYNKSWVTVDFEGITFEEENTSLMFTMSNNHRAERNFWINYLVVDNAKMGEYISIGNCPGDTSRDLNYSIKRTYEKKGKHTFVFTMQIDDEADFEIGVTNKITVTVDFDNGAILVK